jgi:nucleoid-associated protein YgaU
MAYAEWRPVRELVALIVVAALAVLGYFAWDAYRQTDSGTRLALSEPEAVSPAPQPSPPSEEQAIPEEEPAATDAAAAASVVEPAPSPSPDTRAEAPAASQTEATTALAQPLPQAVEEPAIVTATPPAVPRAQPAEPAVDAVVPTEPAPAAAAPELREKVVGEKPVTPPTFDVVRVSPEGTAVIAGRAEPGAQVVVSDEKNVIGEVTADARGEWVVVPEAPLEPGPTELALVQRTTEGATVESDSVVVLAVPERKTDPPGPQTETEAGKAESPGVIAVLVPRQGGGTSEVLQEPSAGVGIKGPEKLSLDTIDYDDKGNVALGGRGDESNEVIVYLDDEFIGRGKVEPDSGWRVAPKEAMPPGLHRLRIDQVDPAGKVVARIETPFASADFTLPKGDDGVVVVQPGNSLWRIARRIYGGGLQYVVIYEANRDQIVDPDLIYPGQIFVMPRTN